MDIMMNILKNMMTTENFDLINYMYMNQDLKIKNTKNTISEHELCLKRKILPKNKSI